MNERVDKIAAAIQRAPAVDREALAEVLNERFALDHEDHWRSLDDDEKRQTQAWDYADAILAAGVVADAADVRREVAEALDASLEALYDEHMADAVAHRELAEKHKREGNRRKAETHMNTAHAFRNTAAGVAEARVRIAREAGGRDGD